MNAFPSPFSPSESDRQALSGPVSIETSPSEGDPQVQLHLLQKNRLLMLGIPWRVLSPSHSVNNNISTRAESLPIHGEVALRVALEPGSSLLPKAVRLYLFHREPRPTLSLTQSEAPVSWSMRKLTITSENEGVDPYELQPALGLPLVIRHFITEESPLWLLGRGNMPTPARLAALHAEIVAVFDGEDFETGVTVQRRMSWPVSSILHSDAGPSHPPLSGADGPRDLLAEWGKARLYSFAPMMTIVDATSHPSFKLDLSRISRVVS